MIWKSPSAALLRALFLGACGLAACAASAASEGQLRERLPLNAGWRFHEGDTPDADADLTPQAIAKLCLPVGNPFTKSPAPPAAGAPENLEFTKVGFDDAKWRLLDLPHDWGVEGDFKQEYPGDTGKLKWWGVAWYRKSIDIPASDDGRRIHLDVDGAMSYAAVWINGRFAGGWPYGYASWQVDLTPYLNYGGKNIISIRLDNPAESSRWYPGGGIYRNVWLVKTSPVHVARWGTYVTTPDVGGTRVKVRIQTDVENDSDAAATVRVNQQIYELTMDGKLGKPLGAVTSDDFEIPPHSRRTRADDLVVTNPQLWEINAPHRYTVVTSVAKSGVLADRYETPFGIRTIGFEAEKGFLLNGKLVELKGVCNHSDLGALGTAVNVRGLERQIAILQTMGCNAIRTSHNPPTPEFLELCDKMGMLVMDESFDCWKSGKRKNDYNLLWDDWHERDWRAELRRDRNHPCIILWSIGNEVVEQGKPAGKRIAAELTDIAHEEDPTRPTCSGNNNVRSASNGYADRVDIFGFNYKPGEYAKFRKARPDQPLIGSETASCVSSRGEYFFPVGNDKAGGLADFQVSSYDLSAPPWAMPPDWEFKGQDENPAVPGEFVWTGFDYLGEPTPYNKDVTNLLNFTDPAAKAKMKAEMEALGKLKVPSRSSYFGIVDLAGFPKDRYYIYQARWRPDFPMAHILPHWTWPDRVGLVTPVMVYTSGDEAELFLNGKSLGRMRKGKLEYRLRWDDVIYQPGELKVVAYKNGKRWATAETKTAGPPAKLLLSADRNNIHSDGGDLSFVTLTVADQEDRISPVANNSVKFSIDGPGEIVATDNGDATDLHAFRSSERKAFNGLALAIVRAKSGTTGKLALKAEAEGLEPAMIEIQISK